MAKFFASTSGSKLAGGLALADPAVAARTHRVAGSGRSRGGDRGRAHTEGLLERLDALGKLEHRDALELVNPFVCTGGH
jgi:hypothetical protein